MQGEPDNSEPRGVRNRQNQSRDTASLDSAEGQTPVLPGFASKEVAEESTWKEGKATTPDRRSNSGHGGSDQPDFIGWYIEYAPNPRSMGPSHRETGPFFGFIDEFRGGLWTVAAAFPRVSE